MLLWDIACLLEPWDRNEALLGRTGPRAPDPEEWMSHFHSVLTQSTRLPELETQSRPQKKKGYVFVSPPKSQEVRQGIKYKVSNLCHPRIAVVTLQKHLALPMP